MSSLKKDCDVCCDQKTKFVKCLYCSQEACRSCYETYVLDQNITKCMFCNKNWNFEFIQTNFSKTFVNGKLKSHREEIISEREKLMMPETQLEIGVIIHNEAIHHKINENEKKIKELKKERIELHSKLKYFNKKELEPLKINYPCTKDNCRGFLNKWKCGLCNTKICKDCREELKDSDEEKYEHKCDENILATIKEIQKEAKPCPKCTSMISKISGCDQMWCTMCKTTFSWKTGRIEEGVVHNPHYWEYMTKRGQDLEALREMEGIQNLPNRECVDIIHIGRDHVVSRSKTMRELCRGFIHFRNIEIRPFENEAIDIRNKDLRIKYLRNMIDYDKFKNMVYIREKKVSFNDEMREILNAYNEMTKDALVSFYYKFLDDRRAIGNIKINYMCNEIVEINNYILESISKLSKRYVYVFPNSIRLFIESINKVCESELKVVK